MKASIWLKQNITSFLSSPFGIDIYKQEFAQLNNYIYQMYCLTFLANLPNVLQPVKGKETYVAANRSHFSPELFDGDIPSP